jgi:tetratricopeptide (TPR) repeat protein
VLHDAEVRKRFGDRRWFVRLDAANDERALWTTILAALGDATPGADPAAQVLTEIECDESLLVLDNLETPWNADEVAVEEALVRLADAEGVRVVTSIRGAAWPGRVNWLRLPTLDSLPPEPARQLFLQIAGEQLARDPDLDALVSAMDGLPLAIELLARQAQGSQQLAGLLADFQSRKAELFELGEGKERSLKASLALSLDSPRMTNDGKRLFASLGRLPGGASTQDLNKLLPVAGRAAGRVLCQLGLAFEEQERLRMLAPIREHAAQRPTGSIKVLVRHYLKLANLGSKVGRVGGAAAVARLSLEIANLEAAVDLAIRARLVPQALAACRGIGELMTYTGLGSLGPLRRLAVAAREAGMAKGEANCLRYLADVALCRSEHEDARALLERALPLDRQVGNVRGEARCIFGLGAVALRHSQYEYARSRYNEALLLYKKVDEAEGAANCVASLGDVALEESCIQEASVSYNAALPIFQRLGSINGAANCIHGLGRIAMYRSQFAKADAHFEETRPFYQEVGALQGEANALAGLGETALRRAQYVVATDRFEAALSMYESVGNMVGRSNCIFSFGEIAREKSEYEIAMKRYNTAIAFYRQLQVISGEAFCLLGMGQIARILGNIDAEPQLRKALWIFDHVSQLEGRGKVLLELAELEPDTGTKRQLLLDALDSHTRFGNPRWIGETHRRLARISEGDERGGHVAAAREAWAPIDLPHLMAELDAEFGPA